MKNFTHFLLAIILIINTFTATSQVKKPKPKVAAVQKNLILGQDLEGVTLKLDEILTRNGYVFENLTDQKIFGYDDNGISTNNVNSYKRYLDLKDNIRIILTANKDNKIYDFSLTKYSNNQNFKTEETKLLNLLNFNNWIIKDQNNTETIFFKGQNLLTTSKKDIRINAFTPLATEFSSKNYSEIIIDSLNIETKFDQVQLFTLQKLKKANLKLIYIKENDVETDKDNNFIASSLEIVCAQGITVYVISDKVQKKQIRINCSNPIIFNNIKKVFFDNYSWISQYEFRRNSGGIEKYFKNKNVLASVNDDSKTIKLLITPTDNNSVKKITYGKPLSLNNILEVYNGFDNQDNMRKYMRDFYYHDGTSPNEAYSFFKDAQKIKILFGDGIENWGFKFLVDSENNILNSTYKDAVANFENLTSQDFKLEDGTFRTQFYDANIYNNAKAENQKQREINQEKQRQEELQRQQIAEERRQQAAQAAAQAETERIEKARRTEASMRELNGAMQNLINAYTKKP